MSIFYEFHYFDIIIRQQVLMLNVLWKTMNGMIYCYFLLCCFTLNRCWICALVSLVGRPSSKIIIMFIFYKSIIIYFDIIIPQYFLMLNVLWKTVNGIQCYFLLCCLTLLFNIGLYKFISENQKQEKGALSKVFLVILSFL